MESSKHFGFASSLCNKLEKLNPPPFITVHNSNSKLLKNSSSQDCNSKSAFLLLDKLKDSLKSQHHKVANNYLSREISLLNGFIERKGVQLRLEKALQLSNQILKVGMRWKFNEFCTQLERFVDSGAQNCKGSKINRLPSRQWAQWIAYLCLRESVLLVKVKIECEKAAKFWLGLISSSHHWGDSLVVTAILSRIWHLSTVIFKSIEQEIYPKLYKLVKNLKPNDAPNWPSEEFAIPQDLKHWLQRDMNLYFVDNGLKSPFLNENSQNKTDGEPGYSLKEKLKKYNHRSIIQKSKALLEIEKCRDSHNDEEDLGVVVKLSSNSLNNKPTKKSLQVESKKNTLKESEWSGLLKNHKKLLRTPDGRKKLFSKIKKCLNSQTNEKIKLKLRNILRSILAISDDDLDKVINLIDKFQQYAEAQQL